MLATIVADNSYHCQQQHNDTDISTQSCPDDCLCLRRIRREIVLYDIVVINCTKREASADNYFDPELDVFLRNYPYDISALYVCNAPLKNSTAAGLSAELSDNRDRPPTCSSLSQIRWLSIINTTLSHLGSLGCFNRSLAQFTAADNSYLVTLRNNTFHGLKKADTLTLDRNGLQNIEPLAFYGIDRASLTAINIRDNLMLQWLGTWPIHLLATFYNPVTIDLSGNRISSFYNDLGLTYHPDSDFDLKHVKGSLILAGNWIPHMSDLSVGWEIKAQGMEELFVRITQFEFMVDMRDNPIACDCKDYGIISKIREIKNKNIPQLNDLTCLKPNISRAASPGKVKILDLPLTSFVCQLTCTSGCTCLERPADDTVTMNCSSRYICHIPDENPVPMTAYKNPDDYGYTLNLGTNKMSTVEARSYFQNVTIADFSENAIDRVHYDAMEMLQNVTELYLHNNRLRDLPSEIMDVEFKRLKNISLHNNMWTCDCNRPEMGRFLEWLKHLEKSNLLTNRENITCDLPIGLEGAKLLDLSMADLCPDTSLKIAIIAPAVSCAALVILLLSALAIIYRNRVWIYAKFHVHPFDKYECSGDDIHNDVFICNAHEDNTWVLELIDTLEADGYKTLHHERDFTPGRYIPEMIAEGIEKSKRILCVLSPSFVASPWCSFEFVSVLNEDINKRERRLILVVKEDVPQDELSFSLQNYMKNFSYIKAWDKDFEMKLKYALPVKKCLDHVA